MPLQGTVIHVRAQLRYLIAPSTPAPASAPPTGPASAGLPVAADGLALDEFAANELSQAPLGDLRLSMRLVQTTRMQDAAPMASIPAAPQGLPAAVKATAG